MDKDSALSSGLQEEKVVSPSQTLKRKKIKVDLAPGLSFKFRLDKVTVTKTLFTQISA